MMLKSRNAFLAEIDSIPAWKRLAICLLIRPEQWRLGSAYAKAAIHSLYSGDDALFVTLRQRSDEAYAKVYGIAPPTP